MTFDEDYLHGLSIEEIDKIRRLCEDYIRKWYGFDSRFKVKRTQEWVEKASKRLEGKTTPCCECGEDYPVVDLHFGDQVFCAICRKEWAK